MPHAMALRWLPRPAPPGVLSLLMTLACVLSVGTAHAARNGITGRSGKQAGTSCVQCHGAANGNIQLSVAIENTDGTPAVQPLSPFNTYVLRARTVRPASTTAFFAGFNLATGTAANPRQQGLLLVHAGDTTARVAAGEATHVMRKASVAAGADQVVEWLVDWKPPAFAAGVTGSSRVYLASRAPNVGVRLLSAVSQGAFNAGMECTAQNTAACGIPVTISATTCDDRDGDGFMASGCSISDPAQNGGDCNDQDAAVFPAAEQCNGRDDNCADGADEGLTLVDFYPDVDRDTYGDATATAVRACNAQRAEAMGVVHAVTSRSDCNDNDMNVRPNGTELCDGVDQNCNDRVDETFTFNGIRLGQFCDSADPDTCANGIVRCMGTMAVACMDDLPRAEVCDPEGNDDNCDGMPDTVAFPTLGQLCTSAQGCASIQECTADGTGTRCADVVPEARDICGNQKDDDCDGATDEAEDVVWNGLAFGAACDSAADADRCASGHVGCSNNRAACLDDTPTPELCADGTDNDCDMETDEADCTASGTGSSSASNASMGGASGGSSGGPSQTSSAGTGSQGAPGGGGSSGGGGGNPGPCACAQPGWRTPAVGVGAAVVLWRAGRRRRGGAGAR